MTCLSPLRVPLLLLTLLTLHQSPGLPAVPQGVAKGVSATGPLHRLLPLPGCSFSRCPYALCLTSFNSAPMSPLTVPFNIEGFSHLYLDPQPLTLLHLFPLHFYCLTDTIICLFTRPPVNSLSLLPLLRAGFFVCFVP